IRSVPGESLRLANQVRMPLTATAGLAMATRQVSSSSTRLRLRGAAFPLRRVCCRQRDDGHWKTPTLVAALYIDRMTAPYAIDGAMDGPSFLSYVEQVLTPTLRKGHRLHRQPAHP